MFTMEAVVLTVDQYEQLQREVQGRVLVGAEEIGDAILARLLEEHERRHSELVADRQPVPAGGSIPNSDQVNGVPPLPSHDSGATGSSNAPRK